jgi:hypothetical protein
MGDQGKIIAGLIFFLILATFPIWYTVGFGGDVPLPERGPAKDGSACIEADMVARHMDILNQWRHEVVRGQGGFESEYPIADSPGEYYEKSLTKTCMKCHSIESRSNGVISCSECHVYANVELRCWDCHVDAEGN